MTPTPPDKDELTQKIYEAMQIPYLSERHDAINRLIAKAVTTAKYDEVCYLQHNPSHVFQRRKLYETQLNKLEQSLKEPKD